MILDRTNVEIKEGSYILYAHVSGYTAGLRKARVLSIKEKGKNDYSFTVRPIERSWKGPGIAPRKVTIHEPQRIVVLEPTRLTTLELELLAEEVMSEEAYIKLAVAENQAAKEHDLKLAYVEYLQAKGYKKAKEK